MQVAEFVSALALSWKNLAAYPPGHPAVATSLDIVNRKLAELRGPAGEVTLGISTDGLLYGSLKLESIAAQKFAQALYLRGVAVLRLAGETTTHDIETFLRLLGAAPPTRESRPISEELTSAGVININLQPINYGAVTMTDRVDETPANDDQSLWDEIVRALLDNQQFSGRQSRSHLDSADELARMIARYVDPEPTSTFDPDATFGIRMPIRDQKKSVLSFLEHAVGQRIAQTTGFKRQHSLEQAMQLIRTLPDPMRAAVLRAVVQALATNETAGALLRQFTTELPNDEVLDALRYLSSTGGMSAHAMTLLQSLTTVESSSRAETPSASVVSDLVRLFGEEDLDRFNPPDHQALLATTAIHIPRVPPEAMSSIEQLGASAESVGGAELARQFGRVLLDILTDENLSKRQQAVLERLESVFRSYVSASEFEEAVRLIEQLQKIAAGSDALRQTVNQSLSRLAAGDTVQALVDLAQNLPTEKAKSVQHLIAVLGGAARHNLLVVLAQENNRSRRRRLFDFAVSLGNAIVPEVIGFLNDVRWYVVRNMIVLLRTVNDRTSLPEIRKLARHRDLRVRMEAIKSLFALDGNVSRTLLDEVLNDPDPKVAETAIALIGTARIKEAVDPLLHILNGNDLFGARRSARMKALRALGEIGEPRALHQLERFFSISRLPWPSKEERYLAWESLQRYPPEARDAIVEKGLRAADPQIREICARFARS